DDHLIDTRTWTGAKATRDFGSEIWRIGINAPGSDQYRWAALGVVGDVRFYNRALGSGDVEAMFKAESGTHDR
ncbi:MAG TPA: hypothetical protein VG457_20350, partial [Planctomycetota bacterium]|nr:hypothetical protein [Planctomycetota bacterium]